jgi:hypothetical protein
MRCAACVEPGKLDPYPGVAKAAGWGSVYAHLDCARYQVSTKAL